MKHTESTIFNSIKKHLPTGFLLKAINIPTSNLYKMFKAFAKTFKKEYDYEQYLITELNPETTYDLITDWEKFVGIPDGCFEQTGSIEQRRNQVLTKLTAQVQTAEDFEKLAAKLGVTVSVYPKIQEEEVGFPLTLPYTLLGDADFFTMIVDVQGWEPSEGFPLTLPYTLGTDQYQSLIQCLFEKLKPADCIIEYI